MKKNILFIAFIIAMFMIMTPHALHAQVNTNQKIKDTVIATFSFVVPENFEHDRQLASFEQNRNDFRVFLNDTINDENFKNVGVHLEPGIKYVVTLHRIRGDSISLEDCIILCKEKHYDLVGPQGLTLVWQQRKKMFPYGSVVISLCEKDALWQDPEGYHWVPWIMQLPGTDSIFRHGVLEKGWGWGSNVVLMCFKKAP